MDISTRPRKDCLRGRTALVLGAAGELGRAAAATLAGLGARVIVADHDRAALEGVYSGDDRFALSPIGVAGDALESLAAALPEIDVVVHGPVVRDDTSASRRDEEADLASVRHFVPAMTRRRRGSIIALAGAPSNRPSRAHGTATRGPHRIHQTVRSLASELRPYGVRVNAVAPDGVVPALAVAFLASDASTHVTGALLAIENGWSSLETIDERTDAASPVGAGLARSAFGPSPAAGLLTVLPSRADGSTRTIDEEVHERRRA